MFLLSNNRSFIIDFFLPGLVPFLPVKEDFHPKRNQARQKLATLAIVRFKDLASDVYSELARRYIHLNQDHVNIDISIVCSRTYSLFLL